MTINVNTNVSAMTAQRYLTKATGELNTSMERLSSGNRINSAKDDAAGPADFKPFNGAISWFGCGNA